MIIPKPQDVFHKIQLYRLLSKILDDPLMSLNVFFKGGTCASMLGYLDRFSIDLDFDLSSSVDKKQIEEHLIKIFSKLSLTLKQQSTNELFYVVGYESKVKERNNIKLSFLPKITKYNIYNSFYLSEIDRYATCQTVETMFSHKLVSLTDRYKKHKMIAGRDLYDIHYFFLNGQTYISQIIEERTGKSVQKYFIELKNFIENKINDKVISEDLNFLLPAEKFKMIRKTIKQETTLFISEEIEKLKIIKR